MSEADELVLIFTRYPEVGKVKTRLAKGIGAEEACAIHDRLARHAVNEVRNWGGRYELWVTGGERELWLEWLGPHVWRSQGEGDLGERMQRAFDQGFASGVGRVVVMGTDCPALDEAVLEQAFSSLDQHDVVIGPADDGGYYLLGLKKPMPELFSQIPWGTAEVLNQTTERLPVGGYHLLRVLSDIDEVADLEAGLNELCRRGA